MATIKHEWSKSVSGLMTVDSDNKTYSSGNSSYGYYGMDSSENYRSGRYAIGAINTSGFPSATALKYKRNLKFELAFGKTEGWEYYNSKMYPSEAEGNFTIFGSSKSVDEIMNLNSGNLADNIKLKESERYMAFVSESRSTLNVSASAFMNTTTVLRFRKLTNDHVFVGKIAKSGLKFFFTYESDIPTVADNGSAGDFVHTNTYNLSFRYQTDSGAPMGAYSVRWVASNGMSGTVPQKAYSLNNGGVYSHIFPANTFPFGKTKNSVSVQFFVTVYDVDGVSSGETLIKTAYSNGLIPTGAMSAPINGAEIFRSVAQRFSWSYSDLGGKAQKKYQIEYTNGGRTNIVSGTNGNLYHDFPAGTFSTGAITYYLTVTSADDIEHRSGAYTANAILSTPSVNPTAPINMESLNKSKEITFKWDYSDPANLKQTEATIRFQVGSKSYYRTITGDVKYCTFPAYSFPEGEIEYDVTVKNTDGQTAKSGVQKFVSTASVPKVVLTYPTDGTVVNYSQSFGVTWDFSEDIKTGQKSWKITIGSHEYTGTEETSYVIDAKDIGEGNHTIRIEVENNDGKTASAESHFSIVKSTPIIDMTYPVGILVKKDAEVIFLWNYSGTPLNLTQKTYNIVLQTPSGAEIKVKRTSAEHFHKFDAGYFDNGVYRYTVEVENTDGKKAITPELSFTAVGSTDAPTVSEVTNDAKPIIKWTVTSQSAYEIKIYNGSDLVYESGLVTSSEDRQHKADALLENGRYTAKMRVVNEYGYYSEYSDFAFVISAANSHELGGVFATQKEDAIHVNYRGTIYPEMYVVRRDDAGKVENLGLYKDGFVDYTIPLNKNYQYAILDYNIGIKYSVWRNIKIAESGVIIRDADNLERYVHLWKTDSDNLFVKKSDDRSKVKYQCLGRRYPVRENGEWRSSERSFNAYVTLQEYDLLKTIQLSSSAALYQGDGEYMKCDIEVVPTGKYIDGNMFVDVTLERIDE